MGRKVRRRDFKRRTATNFNKKYGDWIYWFQHEVTEIPGYTSAITTVRRKRKSDSPMRVGELVHCIMWHKEDGAPAVAVETAEELSEGAGALPADSLA